TTGRLLTASIIDSVPQHIEEAKGAASPDESEPNWTKSRDEFQKSLEQYWPESLRRYKHQFIKPKASKPEQEPSDPFERELVAAFLKDRDKFEDHRTLRSPDDQRSFYYYGAIRATHSCVKCHSKIQSAEEKKEFGTLKEGDLIAVVRIRMDTRAVEEAV